MREKVQKTIQKCCDVVELCIAFAVGLGLLISVILYAPLGLDLLTSSPKTSTFLQFLEDMFSFIVGVEFIKMLCKPSAENVIEVLVFLVARHMIIGTNTSVDILLSVFSVALLYGIRLLLRHYRQRSGSGQNCAQTPEPPPPESSNSEGHR